MDILGEITAPRLFRQLILLPEKKLPIHYAFASDEEVNLACSLADQASLQLAELSGKAKAEFLNTLADGLEEAVDDIVNIMTLETGLPEQGSGGDWQNMRAAQNVCQIIEDGNWVDARIDRAQPDRQPLPKPDLRSMLRPVGPVAVFCASNFPWLFP